MASGRRHRRLEVFACISPLPSAARGHGLRAVPTGALQLQASHTPWTARSFCVLLTIVVLPGKPFLRGSQQRVPTTSGPRCQPSQTHRARVPRLIESPQAVALHLPDPVPSSSLTEIHSRPHDASTGQLRGGPCGREAGPLSAPSMSSSRKETLTSFPHPRTTRVPSLSPFP